MPIPKSVFALTGCLCLYYDPAISGSEFFFSFLNEDLPPIYIYISVNGDACASPVSLNPSVTFVECKR